MNWTTLRIGVLLFGSGACALVYQTAWLREFRLIFGASTGATAAVLAVFMAGLGVGSLLLGRRADEHPRPLGLYGLLELGIAASATLTPVLLLVARASYAAVGGTVAVGETAGTAIRLLLSAAVLAVPTILMGGTLPAAARAAEADGDTSRRRLALLYGLNTLGAVAGAVISTFFLLEALGNRETLWVACIANAIIAIAAILMSRLVGDARTEQTESIADEVESTAAQAPPTFVFVAAAVVGFAFFLMEIVWYRMLGPLLGGSTFTFGLILAVALFGVGIGGAAYALVGPRKPVSLAMFATSCAVEAICLAYPFALGDRVAILAGLLRPLGRTGLDGFAASWAIVTAVVALPAAIVAGYQFPMLVSLLGRGRELVGRHVATAYASNTVGAIAGSLAAGFGVLPLLGATGAWRLAVGSLVVLGAAAAVVAVARTGRPLRLVPSVVASVLAVMMVLTAGPTAAWRHSPIGVGRVGLETLSATEIEKFLRDKRRAITWSVDGKESAVAIDASTGYAFIVNGKSDGHSRYDAPTQVMSGLLGALVHPSPKSAFVIGLGTGSTAGWLGAIPEMERVDVVEFEPAIVEVANMCSPVNAGVLTNPKVHVTFGDAREVVTTSDRRYDVVFSEPSNPYRAGVASLFTRDFYLAARERVAEGGVFVQWFQTYEVDGSTIETAAATLASVFSEVQLWQTQSADLMLIASDRPLVYDVTALRERISREPFKSALANVWRVTDLEGVFARFVADASVARSLADDPNIERNTDDRNFLEFGFARTLGMRGLWHATDILRVARDRKAHLPPTTNGDVDWISVEQQLMTLLAREQLEPSFEPAVPENQVEIVRAKRDYAGRNYKRVTEFLRRTGHEPTDPYELQMAAESLANEGDETALPHIERLREISAIDAECLLARLRYQQGKDKEAAAALDRAYVAYRSDAWADPDIVDASLDLAVAVAQADASGSNGRALYSTLETPFTMLLCNEKRLHTLYRIARASEVGSYGELTLRAVENYEPNPLWTQDFLDARLGSYSIANHPRLAVAQEDVIRFTRSSLRPFGKGTRLDAGQ